MIDELYCALFLSLVIVLKFNKIDAQLSTKNESADLNVILDHLTPDEKKLNNKMNGLFFDKLYKDINMKNKTLLLKDKNLMTESVKIVNEKHKEKSVENFNPKRDNNNSKTEKKSNERKTELSNNEQTTNLVKTYLENTILLISIISRICGFTGALFAIDFLVFLLQAVLK